MNYFSLAELVASDYARRYHIDNTPPAEVQRHLQQLIEELLDPLRAAWTTYCHSTPLLRSTSPAIRVTSGYRCEALNRAVGGVPHSAHRLGLAADLQPANGRMAEFKEFCVNHLRGCAFDQMISEREDCTGTPQWIHLALYDAQGRQRRQIFSTKR